MCTYIIAVLSADGDEKLVKTRAEANGLCWNPLDNRRIQNVLRPGERTYSTSSKYCQCHTSLGSLGSSWQDGSADLTRGANKLRRKGWSESKVARWLENKNKDGDRRSREKEREAHASAGGDESSWLGFLNDVLANRVASSVGVLVHEFRGSLLTERIKLSSRHSIRLAQANALLLREMEYDHLYEFRLDPR